MTAATLPFLNDNRRIRYLLRERTRPYLARGGNRPIYTGTSSGSAMSEALGYVLRVEDSAQVAWPVLEDIRENVTEEPAASTAATVSDAAPELIVHRVVEQYLTALLTIAKDETFEDGTDSNLSLGLERAFGEYSMNFAEVLGERLKASRIGPRIITEILHTLGRLRDDQTRAWRFGALVDSLQSPSPEIRDAAAVGLSYLDDVGAANYLRDAIARERLPSLRDDIRKILDQLGT